MRLCNVFKLTDFGLGVLLEKVKFEGKGGGGGWRRGAVAPAYPPFNPPLCFPSIAALVGVGRKGFKEMNVHFVSDHKIKSLL